MSGYGRAPEDVAESVARCIATGVAGLSIEDATGDSTSPLYDLPIALERVRAARQAVDESGQDVLLTARAECYHVSHPRSAPRISATAPGIRGRGGGRALCPERTEPRRNQEISSANLQL